MSESHGGQWVEGRNEERVTVRISKDQLERLDDAVDNGRFAHRSEVIRDAIDGLLSDQDGRGEE